MKRIICLMSIALVLQFISSGRLFASDSDGDGYNDEDVYGLILLKMECDGTGSLNWTGSDYGTWPGVYWSSVSPRQVVKLDLSDKSLGFTLNANRFPKLKDLYCQNNNLSQVNTNGLSLLKTFWCSDNVITSLDCSSNTALTEILCNKNQISSINISGCSNLSTLDCSNNQLLFSTLPSYKLSIASFTYAPQNKAFTTAQKFLGYTIDYSSQAVVGDKNTVYSWYKNGVQLLYSGNSYKPSSGGTYYCRMTNANYPDLTLQTNPITILVDPNDLNGDGYHDSDVAKVSAIKKESGDPLFPGKPQTWPLLSVPGNTVGVEWNSLWVKRITRIVAPTQTVVDTVDFTGLDYLEEINLFKNKINVIKLTYTLRLNKLSLFGNNLSELDLTGLTDLTEVSAGGNQLRSLLTDSKTKIAFLDIGYNQFSSFDLLRFPELKSFYCESNSITALDFSNNPLVEMISANDNELAILNMDSCSVLETVSCQRNRLPLSVLVPIKDLAGVSFICQPQKQVFGKKNLLYGVELQYPDEDNLNGNATTFTWYRNGAQVVRITGQNGKIATADYGTGAYWCVMRNDEFPTLDILTDTIHVDTNPDDLNGDFYHDGDVAALSGLLKSDGSRLFPGEPADWTISTGSSFGIIWTEDIPYRIKTVLISRSDVQAEVDFSSLADLEVLNCAYNSITSLNLSNLPRLRYAKCTRNQIDTLMLENNYALLTLYADSNQIRNIDISQAPVLDFLTVSENKISQLDLSGCPLLKTLYVSHNQLTSLDLNPLGLLQVFACANNAISMLNVSNLSDLRFFECAYNLLTSLDVSHLSNLFLLSLGQNNISELNLTDLPELIAISCQYNKLTRLDLSGKPKLKYVSCSNNNLPFSQLPVTLPVSGGYLYRDPQNPIYPEVEDQPIGAILDYSHEEMAGGQITTYVWYRNGSVVLGEVLGKIKTDFYNAGTYVCKMTNPAFPGMVLYTAAVDIYKNDQQYIGESLISKVYGDVPFSVPGTFSSGLEFSVSVSDENVALWEDNKIVVNGAGSTTIRLSQDGNYKYNPIIFDLTLTVSKASQTILNFNDISCEVFGGKLQLQAQSSSGLPLVFESGDPALAWVDGNLLIPQAVGETTLTATQQGSDDYLSTEKTVRLTVLDGYRKNQIITGLSDQTRIVDSDPFIPDGVASSGLPLTYGSDDENVALIDNGTVVITGIGVAAITARQAGNTEFAPAEYSFLLTVVAVGQNLFLSGLQLSDTQNDCYNAFDTITVAGDGTSVVFESGSTANLIAGKSIRFLPGFHARQGCSMSAVITTDSSFCDGKPASMLAAGQEKSLEYRPATSANTNYSPGEKTRIRLYPNPSSGRFTIETAVEEPGRLWIVNLIGQSVYGPVDFSSSCSVNLEGATKGIYICRIRNYKGTVSQKIEIR